MFRRSFMMNLMSFSTVQSKHFILYFLYLSTVCFEGKTHKQLGFILLYFLSVVHFSTRLFLYV